MRLPWIIPFGGHFNCDDFFAVRLSTNGGGLLWGTFLGGSTIDQARAVTCDNLGNAYVAGYTSSEDFPLYDSSFGAAIVVCKLTNDASTMEYNHYVESGSATDGGVSSHPGLTLAGNFPNPFNPKTSIGYTLPEGAEDASVQLGIYDVNGRLVRLLMNDRQSAGEHSVDWLGRDSVGRRVSAGVYYYRLSWGTETLTKPMVLLK